LPLATFRVLVVEDEMLVAMAIEDIVAEAGGTVVGPVGTLVGALALIEQDVAIDAAIIDLNLDRQSSLPLADALAERGVPFIVCTGYGNARLPSPHQNVPVLGKPYGLTELAARLGQLLVPRPA
jgi:DNA-binding NtrC family response regulator